MGYVSLPKEQIEKMNPARLKAYRRSLLITRNIIGYCDACRESHYDEADMPVISEIDQLLSVVKSTHWKHNSLKESNE